MRSRWFVVTLTAAALSVAFVNTQEHRALAAAGVPAGMQLDKRADSPEDIVARGFAIAPVTLHYRKNVRDLVGLGSYIVNSGGCNDCHTNPSYAQGHDPFLGQPEQVNTAGYLGGGQAFGPFLSRNLTPDENGLPAGLTWDQFRTAIAPATTPSRRTRSSGRCCR